MPAFGEALSNIDLSKVIQHIRGFCSDGAWPRGELNLPRPLVTEKAFPENEAVYTATIAAANAAVRQRVLYERRLGARTQWEVVVPVDVQESETAGWQRGSETSRSRSSTCVHHSLEAGRFSAPRRKWSFPTGKEQLGLGKGDTIFEPFVAFGQILPSDSFLQVQAGLELSSDRGTAPTEGLLASGDRQDVRATWLWTHGRRCRVLGAHELDAGADRTGTSCRRCRSASAAGSTS